MIEKQGTNLDKLTKNEVTDQIAAEVMGWKPENGGYRVDLGWVPRSAFDPLEIDEHAEMVIQKMIAREFKWTGVHRGEIPGLLPNFESTFIAQDGNHTTVTEVKSSRAIALSALRAMRKLK